METVTFRNYTAADRNRCIEIYISNTPKFFDITELNGFKSWLDSKDNLTLAHISNELESYSVIEVNNTIIGCGGFYFTTHNAEARMAWGMIDNLYHLKGFGQKLLDYRLKQIQKLNPDIPIALDTTQYSFGFFEKLGFKVTKIQKDYYALGFDRYDMVKGR